MEHEKAKEIIKKHFGETGVLLFEKILSQKFDSADAIVLLQGDRLDRVEASCMLYKQGVASHVIISGNNELIGPDKRPGENDVMLEELHQGLMNGGVPEDAIIIEEKALNTLGQAVRTISIAKTKAWSKLIVVASAYHILRVYLTFQKQIKEQQWEGEVVMHAVLFPWDSVPGGREKTALEMLEVEMEKIQTYSEDMASISSL